MAGSGRLREEPLPSSVPPLSLYVHFPWCVRKCPYCDFNSHEADGALPEDGYVDALIRDLDTELASAGPREIISIFIGGGTPSLVSEAAISRLLSAVGRRLNLSGDIEITLEANPGTAEAERFSGYRQAGVNRLSIGVQSLDDTKLAALGRIHDAAEARQAVSMARRAGFANLNVDIMYGLPDQDVDAAASDLEAAIDLEPDHLSWYQLTIEPNTVFYKHTPRVAGDDETWAMQQQGQERLAVGGFRQYEVSAWARPGRAPWPTCLRPAAPSWRGSR